jgi:hypothetical protein
MFRPVIIHPSSFGTHAGPSLLHATAARAGVRFAVWLRRGAAVVMDWQMIAAVTAALPHIVVSLSAPNHGAQRTGANAHDWHGVRGALSGEGEVLVIRSHGRGSV